MDPISTARYGMMAASRSFAAAAEEVAGFTANPDADLVGSVVGMTQAKHAFSANLNVIRFAQDMWDDLLALQAR